jgi:hypothetical protein
MQLRFTFLTLLFSFTVHSLYAQNWVNGGNTLSASGTIGTNSNHSLIFETNGLDRGRITNTGNWGVGTTNPLTKFHVNGFASFGNRVTSLNATRALNLVDDNAVMRVLRVHTSSAPAVELISRTSADGPNIAYWDFYAEPSDKSFRIRDRMTGANPDRLTISGSGNVGIGTTTPVQKLQVVGSADFSGDIYLGGWCSLFEQRPKNSGRQYSCGGGQRRCHYLWREQQCPWVFSPFQEHHRELQQCLWPSGVRPQ